MLSITFLIAVSALAAQSCVGENGSCGIGGRVGVKFRYVKNVEGIDKFATDVERISLYIFDENGRFIRSLHEEGTVLDDSYMMDVTLSPGKYTMIAWGNTEQYEVSSCTEGETSMSELHVNHINKGNIVETFPQAFFHGMTAEVEVMARTREDQVFMIDLMKNTNHITVVKRGLPAVSDGMGGVDSDFSCRITSANGSYGFDNSIVSPARLTYIPQCTISNNEFLSEFVVLRECNDNSTDSRLIVYHHPIKGGPGQEILNVPLIPLLIDNSQTGDLDIDDEFELLMEFQYTHGSISTITINGWEAYNSGGMVG